MSTKIKVLPSAERRLHISPSLSLPLPFVGQTCAILGKKRRGKTYKAGVLAEEMLAAGQQIVVMDPTSAWWGLRSSADGEHAGYPITILGGAHGDLPLDSTAGEAIADAIVTERFSAILDLSDLTKGEEQRFCAAFLDRLYRKNKRPVHLFLDEADVYAPQRPMGFDESKTLGACQSIVRRGGLKGIGVTMITQRPAVLNKDVLSQIDTLILIGMNHPKDLAAIDEWVKVHGDPDVAKELRKSLPALPKGDAWVWAPAQDILERVSVRDKTTFDSSRSPEVGEELEPPKVLAEIDIAHLGEQLAKRVQIVKENDPTVLRRRIAELEARIAARPMTGGVTVVEKVVEKVVLAEVAPGNVAVLQAAIARCEDVATLINKHRTALTETSEQLSKSAHEARTAAAKLQLGLLARAGSDVAFGPMTPEPQPSTATRRLTSVPVADKADAAEETVSESVAPDPATKTQPSDDVMDTRVLAHLAQLSETKLPLTVLGLAAWMGMHPRASNLLAAIGRLRTSGRISGLDLTDDGRTQVGPPPRTGINEETIRAQLRHGLADLQLRVLDAIGAIDAHRVAKSAAAVAIWVGMHPRASNLLDAIGKLRSRGYLDGLDLTVIGAHATAPIAKPSLGDLIEPLEEPQRQIIETVARWPSDSVSTIAVLANTIGVHPRSSTFLNSLGILRARGMLTKGWPVALTDAMRVA